MKKIFTASGVGIVLLVVGGVAYASIPGPDGVIHGCYKTGNPATGSVIVIDSEASCPSGFTTLNWNQMGPQGPAGPGITSAETVTVDHVAEQLPDGRWEADSTAFCPTDKYVVTGGFSYSSDEVFPAVTVTENISSRGTGVGHPLLFDWRWSTAVVADVPGFLHIHMVCARFD